MIWNSSLLPGASSLHADRPRRQLSVVPSQALPHFPHNYSKPLGYKRRPNASLSPYGNPGNEHARTSGALSSKITMGETGNSVGIEQAYACQLDANT